jgi:hypothetical protein
MGLGHNAEQQLPMNDFSDWSMAANFSCFGQPFWLSGSSQAATFKRYKLVWD